MKSTVGVLALQGAYQKHVDILLHLGIQSRLVRKAAELEQCNALIIPGGESTTISRLMDESGLRSPIKVFASKHPIMGVCAGMILMADKVDDQRIKPLALMPFTALRNVYGRQLQSFSTTLALDFDKPPFTAHFIRAPGIKKTSADIEILAMHNKNIVMISKGKHMALSFHPELTNDTRIHEYWLNNANKLEL